MNTHISLNNQELKTFVQQLRGSLSMQDISELALKAIALVSLYPKQTLENPSQAMIEAEAKYTQAFGNGRNLLSQVQHQTALLNFIRYLSDAQTKGIFTKHNKLAWVKLLLADDSRSYDGVVFHSNVYKLCNALLAKTNANNLYIPFETRFCHSVMLKQQRMVYSEGKIHSVIPVLLDLIFGNIHYQMGDAISNPAYIQDGKLQKFDTGFIAEPWGVKLSNMGVTHNDRFAVESTNYQNYLIQHAMQQVNNLLIVIVPANTLVSTVASEENMRQWLLSQKHLKSVISLPSGLLINTNINSSMLVFDLSQQFEQINFISLKDSEFIQRKGRDIELNHIEDLANMIWSDEANHNKTTVSHGEIAQHNYVLDPERYTLDEVSQQALSALTHYSTKKLGDVVDIFRPIPIAKLKEEGGESIYEIQGGDLPAYGYIDAASKQTLVSHTAFAECQKFLLKANDIIITVRGSVGKVGIVSQNLLDYYQGSVIAGQTNMVLRIKANSGISSQALLMQLRSDFGQARLRLLSAGTVITGVSIKDLKEFPIALFSAKKQKELEEYLDNQQTIKQEIEAKQNHMHQLDNDFWL